MKKKLTAAILALLSTAMLFGGCTQDSSSSASSDTGSSGDATADYDSFGKYEEPITFTIGMSVDPTQELPDGDTLQNNQYIRYIKEQLNVDVEVIWTAASSDYDEKVGLAISSDALPDGFVVNDTQFNSLVKNDMIADLTDSYNNYASETMKKMIGSSKGLAVDNVTFDGKMMGLTSVSDGDMLLTWIRKDWLDKLGLEEPKTMADLEAVARAFVEQDPGGNGAGNTIGITGPQNGGALYATFLTSGTNNFGFDSVFNSYGSYPGWWVEDSSGNPIYGSIAPETKTALAKLAELYADGIIDPEMGIRKDSAEPIINGQSGIFLGGWWMGYFMLPDTVANNPEANFQAYTIPISDSGVYEPHASAASYMYAVVRKGYEHPEIAVKLNNLLIRDEATFDTAKGSIGNFPMRIPFGMVDESVFTVNAMNAVMSGEKTPADYDTPDYAAYKLLQDDLKKITTVKLEPYDNLDIQYWDVQADPGAWARSYSILVGWGAFVRNEFNPVYSLTYSQTDTISKKWTNLKKLEDETFMKIIMNQSGIDEFDNFVESWKSQGGDDITQEVADLLAMK